jgi:hypothetical protein
MKAVKKAQVGEKVIKGSRPGMGVFRTTKQRTTSGGLLAPYRYKTESIDTTGYSKGRSNYKLKTEEGEGDKTGSKVKSSKLKTVSKKQVPSILKSLNKAKDGMWMQKAAASIKKRGTAGKCTPITKPGCTGKAKALAKTFKKIAKSNKKK